MPERFTPDELKELAESGDLKWEDITKLDPSDRVTAAGFMKDPPPMSAGPLMPPGLVGLAAKIPGLIGGASLPAVPSLAKKAWNTAAPYLGSMLGAEAGSAVGHPWIGAMLGHQLGGKATFSTSAPKAPSKPSGAPWGQRAATPFGTKPEGPQMPPRGYTSQTPTPPNLKIQGNLTNPGPDGPGSPSTGPDIYRKNPWASDQLQGGGIPIDIPAGTQFRSSDPPNLKRNLAGPATSMDEADKRKVMFGGVGAKDSADKYVPPQKRTPVGRRKPK